MCYVSRTLNFGCIVLLVAALVAPVIVQQQISALTKCRIALEIKPMASQLARLSGNAKTLAPLTKSSLASVTGRSMSTTSPDNFKEVSAKFVFRLMWLKNVMTPTYILISSHFITKDILE